VIINSVLMLSDTDTASDRVCVISLDVAIESVTVIESDRVCKMNLLMLMLSDVDTESVRD